MTLVDADGNVECFNLSILECKGAHYTQVRFAIGVLIYLYWNVKKHVSLTESHGMMVLIYPYWNVKT